MESTPLTAEHALGDFPTIDYCGLLEPGDSGLDGARILDERRDLDNCEVRVEDSTGVSADVIIGELADESYSVLSDEPDETVMHRRGLRIQRYDDLHPNSCVFFLVFPDFLSLQVAGFGEATAKEELCSVAKIVVDGVRRRIESGQPVARLEFGPNSLGTVNACATAGEEDVSTALGVRAEPRVPPSGHWCLWGRFDVRAPSVIVKFRLDDPLQASQEGKADVIAGRDSVMRAEEAGSCLVLTQHITADRIESGTVEIASVSVREVFTEDACSVARKLATVVWQALPTG